MVCAHFFMFVSLYSLVKFDKEDWISPKRALSKIDDMIETNVEKLKNYKKDNAKSEYFKPEMFGFQPGDIESMESFMEAFDWVSYTFADGEAANDKPTIGMTQHDLLEVPHEQQVTTTTNAPNAAQITFTAATTANSAYFKEKYLLDESLKNDPESSQVVTFFWNACIDIDDSCYQRTMCKKESVLSDIEIDDPESNITSSMKLIMQMLLDICQIQLEIKPLTISNTCIFDYALNTAWDMLGCASDECAQSLLVANRDQVSWLTSELFQTNFIQNILKSKRYNCNSETWIEIALSEMDGEAYSKNSFLAGIFAEGVAYPV